MVQKPTTITASEIADCEYCEVSWSLSDRGWGGMSRKISGKGGVAHSEHIRAEEACERLTQWKEYAKIAVILLVTGVLIYLLYFLWR
jgi:hypothetical protein